MSIEGREISSPLKQVGRYTIFQQIAAGGMATVHLARFGGPAGFSRVVAVKHLHAHLSADPQFRAMFIEEARLVSRIRHPNVVPTLDVVVNDAEVFLVMEYIPGESLAALRRAARQQQQDIPLAICSAILVGALQGLHAAHEARSENGQLLGIVHRDISPGNIMVGVDGVSLMLDFGVARAMQGREQTGPGMVKGKSAYMAPEQVRGEPLTRSADIFSAAIVLWELLTTRRLFDGANEHERMYKVLQGANLTPPSTVAARIPAGLDDVVMKGLRPDPAARYQTALEMAEAIEQKIPPASQRIVGEWVARIAAESLGRRAELLQQIEFSDISVPTIIPPIIPPITPPITPGQSAPTGIAGRTTGDMMIGPGSSPGTHEYLPPHLAPRPHPPLWRDRRALAGGAVAALVLAGVFTLSHRSGLIASADPEPRATIGTTVIMKPEAAMVRPPAAPAAPEIGGPITPPPTEAPATGPAPPAETPATAPAPPALAASAPGAGPARPTAYAIPARAPATERRAVAPTKPAHDRAPIRRAAAARGARAGHATAGAVAPAPTSAAAPGTAEGAAPARAIEAPRPRVQPTGDLKKRVPLVDDHPRVEILE